MHRRILEAAQRIASQYLDTAATRHVGARATNAELVAALGGPMPKGPSDPIAVLDIQGIIRHLKQMGIGILITDHNVRETLRITDRAYIINNGGILRAGSPAELSADPQVRKIYLGEHFQL